MTLYQLLQDRMNEILIEATESMVRARAKHYEEAGREHVHQRLKALYVLTMRGVKERNLGPMVAHVENIARERFSSGYDLWEVQTAFNLLEETIWRRILKDLPATEFAEALGLVSTVLGVGKDTLARRYVSLATKAKAPSLNMQSLFNGTDIIENGSN
jgi:hypothetical protein